MEVDYAALRALAYFLREREAVRLRKEAGEPPPWTDDEILREWRFCCVDRRDDRVTRWVRRTISEPRAGHPALWLNLAAARLVCWPPTLEEIGFLEGWDEAAAEAFARALEARAAAGLKVYTGAYIVPAGPAGGRKSRFLAAALGDLWARRAEEPQVGATCAAWAQFLMSADGVGPFVANQVVADLRDTRYLAGASDWETFLLAGPGALRGLDRVFGRKTGSTKQLEAQAAALQIRAELLALAPEFAGKMRDLNNVGNALCEFDKYVRVLLGEGVPRARYAPTTEF